MKNKRRKDNFDKNIDSKKYLLVNIDFDNDELRLERIK